MDNMKKILLNSKSFAIAFVIANLFFIGAVSAQKTWDGGAGTNNWGDANNWNPNGVPAASDAVTLINNTTVNVNVAASCASITFPSGNANNVTLNINNAITLSVTGAITIPRAGASGPTPVNTLAIGSGILSAGSIAFTNSGTNVRHLITISTGTATISGNINGTGGTGSPSITFGGAGLLKVGGSIFTNTQGTLTPGTGTVEYNAATAQTIGDFTYNNLTLSGGGNKTIPTGVTVGGILSMQGTAAAITNAPTYTAGSTLEYKGTAAQTATAIEFPSASGPTNLTINNSNGVTLLNAARTIAGTLTLTNGVMTIPAAATANLILSASPANAIAGSFGAGTHIKAATSGATVGLIQVKNITVSSAYTFPVGDGTNYLPVQLTSGNTLANNQFSVGVFDGLTANGAPNGTAFSLTQKKKVVDAVWIVNYNGTGSPTAPVGVNMQLSWTTGLEGSSFTSNPNALIGIAHSNGTVWGTCQQNSANNATNMVTLNGITSFSPFAVGTIDPGGAPLAIKIYYFNASKGNNANTLNWNALCSSSQATFEIQRSADGRDFNTINSITASQARCASPFSFDDASPLPGTNFYRIKMIDIDGKIDYTSIVKVGAQVKDMQLVGIVPNPVSTTAQLNVTTAQKDKIDLSIISLEGKVVSKSTVSVQSGSSLISLDIANLATGAYFVRGVFSDGQVSTVKFVKQ